MSSYFFIDLGERIRDRLHIIAITLCLVSLFIPVLTAGGETTLGLGLLAYGSAQRVWGGAAGGMVAAAIIVSVPLYCLTVLCIFNYLRQRNNSVTVAQMRRSKTIKSVAAVYATVLLAAFTVVGCVACGVAPDGSEPRTFAYIPFVLLSPFLVPIAVEFIADRFGYLFIRAGGSKKIPVGAHAASTETKNGVFKHTGSGFNVQYGSLNIWWRILMALPKIVFVLTVIIMFVAGILDARYLHTFVSNGFGDWCIIMLLGLVAAVLYTLITCLALAPFVAIVANQENMIDIQLELLKASRESKTDSEPHEEKAD